MSPMSQNEFNPSKSLQQMHQMGLRATESICTIVTMPVEYALRPFFGTRYFDPIQMLFSFVLMLFLPLAGGIGGRYLFSAAEPSQGLLGLGTLSLAFFASQFVHGPRTWRRMMHMEREQHSEFEGPALPFFAQLPYGKEFWPVRIVHEPLFVLAIGIALGLVRALDTPAMTYFIVAAVLLCVKNCLCWYRNWLHLRMLMDAKFAAPLVARAAQGTATENELAQVHMAGFPKGVPADVRTADIAQMAGATPSLPAHIAQLVSPVERDEVGAAKN